MLSTEKILAGRTKYGSIAKFKRARRRQAKQVCYTLIAAVLFIGLAAVISRNVRNTPSIAIEGTPETVTVTVATTAQVDKALSVFIPAMAANGWSEDTLGVNLVDPSADGSEAGSNPFSKKGINSIADAIAFMQVDSWEAEAARLILLKATGCSRDDLLNPEKWVIAQPKVGFTYSQMTLWDGRIRVQESKKGNAGDIFVAFVHGEDVVFIRGGCANPTLIVPIPDVPAPPTTVTTTGEKTTTGKESTTGKETTTGEKTTTGKESTTGKETTTKKGVKKDPSKDVLVNTLVADYKKPGDERMTVNWDPYVSNGIKVDPIGDAKKAADKAAAVIAAANKALEEAQNVAITSGAGVVDSNEGHVAITIPSTEGTTGSNNSTGTTARWSPFG